MAVRTISRCSFDNIDINKTDKYFKRLKVSRERCELLYIVFTCLIFCCDMRPVCSAASAESCAAVKIALQAKDIAVSELPSTPLDGGSRNGEGCAGRTCCTRSLTPKLNIHARSGLDRVIKEDITKIASVLETRARRFDENFRSLLQKSKVAFHDMFKRTYGTIYLQYSYVFIDLFDELDNYYQKGQVDLVEVMDNFFGILYQKMFSVLNAQYKFDEKYLGCVSDNMKKLKPFGDVPHKLNIQLKRSFVATRTFVKALFAGSEVAKNMHNIKLSQECVQSALQMQYCSICAGYTKIRACSNYCVNVMKGCLAYHADLDSDWNYFVDGVEKVSERLLGPFNIVNVVQPINLKISEAIMNFQENGQDISSRVFQGCGKPDANRQKRSTAVFLPRIVRPKRQTENTNLDIQFENSDGHPDYVKEDEVDPDRSRRGSGTELELESLDFDNEKPTENDTTDETWIDDEEAELDSQKFDQLIKDIKLKIKETKNFWSHLPYQFCNNDKITESPSKESHCWNGTAVDKYLDEMVGDGLSAQRTNRAVIVDVTKPNSALNEQLFKLKTMTNKLKNAFNGMDVEWMDTEESIYGSGSGSGDRDMSNFSDDNEDEYSGSGHGYVDYNDPAKGKGAPVYPPQRPPSQPDYDLMDNEIDFKSDATPSAGRKSSITLTRALVTYLFPIVVAWFGGMVSDVL